MKRLLALVSVLICCTVTACPASQAPSTKDKTLSPYFYVETEDSGTDHFPLKSTDVNVVISGVIAKVTVRQSYANMGSRPIHGRYIFPGSTRAAIHGMAMTIGDRRIHAKIKEREKARNIYEKAKKKGKSASLLEQQRPNVFSMAVANIMPGDQVDIELHFTELLVPEDGTYEFVYPTVVGPRYSTKSPETIPEAERWAANPYLKKGKRTQTSFNISVSLEAGMALQDVACPSHDSDILFRSLSQAAVKLSNPADFGGNRDYILRYRLADQQIASGLLLQKGDDENFFLLMAQPPQRIKPEMIPPREYIFVVDVSGSMSGFPLDTAKGLLRDLISGLRTTDSFNLLLFAGDSQIMSPESVAATPAEIKRALAMIDQSGGGGGTELLTAMQKAMTLPSREGVSRTMVVVTDGYINAECEVFKAVQKNLGTTNVFTFGIGSSVNRYLIEGLAKAGRGEPFVVTDVSEAASVTKKFRDYISSPVLTDIHLSFRDLEAYDIEPRTLPDLFAERPVVVIGKFKGEPKGLVELTAMTGRGKFRQVFPLSGASFDEKVKGLDYLWARSRIARISDLCPNDAREDNREEIVALGLKYNLLTAFTSFVAVDEIVRNPSGKGQDVKQPLPLPKGVSNLAVGGMNQVPEPELFLMAFLALVIFLMGRLRRRNKAVVRLRRRRNRER